MSTFERTFFQIVSNKQSLYIHWLRFVNQYADNEKYIAEDDDNTKNDVENTSEKIFGANLKSTFWEEFSGYIGNC